MSANGTRLDSRTFPQTVLYRDCASCSIRPILGQRGSGKIRKVAMEPVDWMYRILLDAIVGSSVSDPLTVRKFMRLIDILWIVGLILDKTNLSIKSICCAHFCECIRNY